MTGSNEARLELGQVDHELTFDYPTFRDLVVQSSRVLAEMEAKADEEAAEWEAQQSVVAPPAETRRSA